MSIAKYLSKDNPDLLQKVLLTTIEDLYRIRKYQELIEAIEETTELIEDKEIQLDLNHKKGVSLVQLGKFSAAIQIFESLLNEEFTKAKIKGLGSLAWVHILLHQTNTSSNLTRAERYCQEALLLSQNYDQTLYVKVLINFGNICFYKGNYQKASTLFLEANSLSNDNPTILNNLAATYVSLREKQLAETYLEKAESLAQEQQNQIELAESNFIRGRIFEEIHEDYTQAKDFYLVAYDFFIEANSPHDGCMVMNILGQLHQKIINESLSILSDKIRPYSESRDIF